MSYATLMMEEMKLFHVLLKPNQQFYWDSTLQEVFEKSKEDIVSNVDGVLTFDVNKPSCLTTDWSKEGIGFLRLQRHCSCLTHIPTCFKTGKVSAGWIKVHI